MAKASELERTVPLTNSLSQEISAKNDLLDKMLDAETETVQDSLASKLEIEPFPSNFPIGGNPGTKPLYPSHELSPKILKIAIIIIFLALLVGGGWYVLTNLDKIIDWIMDLIGARV